MDSAIGTLLQHSPVHSIQPILAFRNSLWVNVTANAHHGRTTVRALAAGYAEGFLGTDNVSINTAFHTIVRLLLSDMKDYEN